MEIIIDKIKYECRAEENGAYVVENHYSGEVRIPAYILVDGQSICCCNPPGCRVGR